MPAHKSRCKALFLTLLLSFAASAYAQLEPPVLTQFVGRWDQFSDFYADVWGDGHYAYLSHFGDSGVNILDISNPANPVQVAEVRPGPPNQFASAQDVQVTDGLMFIGLEADGNDGVLIVDVRDPVHPVQRTRAHTELFQRT